ncbi:MAG: M16 family metallopeptidase [Actinomycetota bacterium]
MAVATSHAVVVSAISRAASARTPLPSSNANRTMAIHRTEYTSGLRVVTERMPGVRSVSLGVWVLAGSRDEAPAISGASHFLEHLLFKGTKVRSAQDIAQAFDAVGGDLNAFTAKEYTCYYARVLDRDLELAVDHLADMLQHSVIRSVDLDGERQVILEEINMHEDSPEDLVHDVFTETLWPDHPLGRPVLGTVATIEAATRPSVRRFYKRHYVPGNFVVAAAGNVRHEDVLSLLSNRMETGRALPDGDASTWNLRRGGHPPAPSGKRLVRRRKTEQAHICLGTNGLARTDPDRFAFLVVNTALGGGMSSRLFQEIRERRGLAYSVYSYHSQYAEAGLFTAYAGTTPARAEQVISLLRGELDDVASGNLTEEEFERARGHVKGSLVLGLEDPGGRMSRLGKSEIAHGEILSVSQTLGRIERVTLDDARRVAERVLSRPMTLTVLGPFPSGAFKEVMA